MNLLQISALTEQEAREYMERVIWPHGSVCPKCGNRERNSRIHGKTARAGLYSCGVCRKQFTVTVGTIMENSHLSCKQWAIAFHLMCSSKKGISALQLQRELGMGSYESAWFLAQRIRAAMEESNKISGTVEIDETYVGGKGHGIYERGKGTKKAPVVAMIGREKGIHTRVVERTDGKTLKAAIREVVTPDSTIMTDQYTAYWGLSREYAGHERVNHSKKEYSRGDAHVNTAESYFALLKRGIHGTFHHVSKKHLERYCHEFNFRWERRKINDSERCDSVVSMMSGKRLTYKKLTE